MNRRTFLKTVCGAVGAAVGWSRVGASSWSSVSQKNERYIFFNDDGRMDIRGNHIHMPSTDMDMTGTKDAEFTTNHIDYVMTTRGNHTHVQPASMGVYMNDTNGWMVPFHVAGEGTVVVVVVDDDGTERHRVYLPQVPDGDN